MRQTYRRILSSLDKIDSELGEFHSFLVAVIRRLESILLYLTLLGTLVWASWSVLGHFVPERALALLAP